MGQGSCCTLGLSVWPAKDSILKAQNTYKPFGGRQSDAQSDRQVLSPQKPPAFLKDKRKMKKNLGKQIVVIDNGFVDVGDVTIEGDFVRIDNAKSIRVWGTKAGLGELRTGPRKETKVDDVGVVLVPFGRVVFFLEVTGW